jgi:hypothetical protein
LGVQRIGQNWLQERLQNLRDQAAAAERAVVQFKAKNNVVSAGGTLINEKQLSDISDELGKARARAADLQARLERMDAVRQTYSRDSMVSALLASRWTSDSWLPTNSIRLFDSIQARVDVGDTDSLARSKIRNRGRSQRPWRTA